MSYCCILSVYILVNGSCPFNVGQGAHCRVSLKKERPMEENLPVWPESGRSCLCKLQKSQECNISN